MRGKGASGRESARLTREKNIPGTIADECWRFRACVATIAWFNGRVACDLDSGCWRRASLLWAGREGRMFGYDGVFSRCSAAMSWWVAGSNG